MRIRGYERVYTLRTSEFLAQSKRTRGLTGRNPKPTLLLHSSLPSKRPASRAIELYIHTRPEGVCVCAIHAMESEFTNTAVVASALLL